MTPAVKDEALEQLELDIKFGFENKEEIFDGIREMFYDEEDFDNEWLRKKIAEKYSLHQKESLTWARPTDFERLAEAFDELIEQKIVCLHNAGYTKQDGEGDCMETIERLKEVEITAIGFCYYHSQDLGRAVDPEIRSLYLGFGSATQDDTEAVEVAHKIAKALKKNGFEVRWAGTVNQRVEIKNIRWLKTPDDQEWGAERVIQLLNKPTNGKKPFWKLW